MVDVFIIGRGQAGRRAHGLDACYADQSGNIP
jgi:hypothetical protein